MERRVGVILGFDKSLSFGIISSGKDEYLFKSTEVFFIGQEVSFTVNPINTFLAGNVTLIK